MENGKIKLILASASPRRKELLGHLGAPFEVMTLNVPEESNASDPREYCREIASLKGAAVFNKLVEENPEQSYFVISADTIVCLENKIFEKPQDRYRAREYLSELSGKTHSVFTAVVVNLIYAGKKYSFSFIEESRVTFNKITDDLMENYLATGDSLDKAGAYGIQGPSLTFISKVEGDYANVVGFPLSRFILESKKNLKDQFMHEDLWQKLF